MKRNGFISSALLYSLLALFLVIMLSTIAILGNRKLSLDKLKENAVNSVSSGYSSASSIYAIYDGYQTPTVSNSKVIWKDVSNNGHDAIVNDYDNNYNAFNRYLAFQNGLNVNTGIKQSSLGSEFTITTVLELVYDSGGIWGYYGGNSGVYARATSTGIDVCYYTSDGNTSCKSISNSSKQVFGKKIELTAVYQSDNGVYVYLNGVSVQGGISTGGAIASSDNLLFIGLSADPSISSDYLNGRVYSFVVNKKALTDAEIASNYVYDKSRFNLG